MLKDILHEFLTLIALVLFIFCIFVWAVTLDEMRMETVTAQQVLHSHVSK